MNSPSLAELQHSLQDYLLKQQNTIAAMTVETEKFSRETRLAIYRDAYYLRLLAALQNDYPNLLLLLGDDAFASLMRDYIAQHPSRHASLRWVGEKVSLFLQTYGDWQGHTYLWELAAFEWAQIMAFDAQDSNPATLDDLRLLDHGQWPHLQLSFQPALQILSYCSNAPQLWHSLSNSQSPVATTITETAQHWLLWRNDLQILYRPLEQSETWCLQAFLRNENFSQVCAGLCEWFAEDEVPLKAVQYLQQWLQDGLVAEISAEQF